MADRMEFFPLDATYRVQDGKAVISMYGRAGDGRQVWRPSGAIRMECEDE